MARELVSMDSFLSNVEQQLDQHAPSPLSAHTVFRDLPGWTSLQSVVMIVSFDEQYGVMLSSEELQNAQTLADLCLLIRSKQGA